MSGQVEQLGTTPTIDTEGFLGYQHFMDPTRLPFNMLTYPSINCFIPSKDKIVPRLGKTILGQKFSKEEVEIGFDSFSSVEDSVGAVTNSAITEFDAFSNDYNSSVKVDATHYLNFWTEKTDGHGLAQVFSVNLTTKVVTPVGTPLVFYNTAQVGHNSCGKVDSTHFINFWAGSGGHGFVQVFNVNLSTFAVTALSSPLTFDSNIDAFNSCSFVDSTHFLNFWTGAATGTGQTQVFAINPSTFAVTAVGSPLTFDASSGVSYNSCGNIDGQHYINFWQTNPLAGEVQVFNVNLSTYAVTALSSPLNFDTKAVSNSCAFVDPTHFINFWATNTNGKAQVFAINPSTFAVTAVGSSFNFSSVVGFYNSCATIDPSHFINFWTQTGGQYAQIFGLDGSYNIEALASPDNFDTRTNTIFNSCVYMGVGLSGEQLIINFWGGTKTDSTSDGAVAVFSTVFLSTGLSLEHVCAGDNRILFVSVLIRNISGGGDRVTGITYHGIAMTLGIKVALDASNERYLYYLVNPDAGIFGANNGVVVTTSNVDRYITLAASSYFGAKQVSPTIMSPVGPNASVTSISISETPTLDKSWIMALFCGGGTFSGGLTEGASTIFRGGNTNFQMADRGPISPAAISALAATFGSSTTAVAIAIAFAPKGGTPEDKNWQIIGHKKRFTNDGGYVMEVRVVRTDDAALKDQIQILLENPITNVMDWYPITERANPLEQGTADRYYMDSFFDTNLNPAASFKNSRLVWVNGTKTIFSWSGGVNPITSINAGVSITGAPGKSWISQGFPHLYSSFSFGEIRYVVINGSKFLVSNSGALLNLNSVVGTFQIGDVVTGSSSGATGKVVSFSSTTVFLSNVVGVFTSADAITGSISGATANVSSATTQDGGWDSDTLLLSSTEGINVGDIATAWIAPSNSSIPIQDVITLPSTFPNIDFCRQNKNYMFYGSFVSRQLFMSNNFNRPPIETITPSNFVFQDDLSVPLNPDFTGSSVVIFRVSIDGASPDKFDWQATNSSGEIFVSAFGITITGNFQQLVSPFGTISIRFQYATGHSIGDTWTITCSPAIGDSQFLGDVATPPAWANFFYNLPRVPGQGYIFFLPANFWTMESQEEEMYISDQYGNWSFITTQVAADLQTETITFTPLKQISASKPIFPYMVGHMENYIVFVTENKTLDFIGRQAFLELPQMSYLSQPVALDFEASTFELGSLEYLNKILYITSPKESVMLVYDNRNENKYWQPPQIYIENGILSIVENTLISHSNLRDQTYNLFTGNNGDDGAEYTVRARTNPTPYFKMVARHRIPARWDSKYSSNSFVEGYVTGNPQIIFTAFQGVNDPNGVSHIIKPVITANPVDTASIGEAVLGAHPLGNDPVFQGSYFNEIYRDFKPILNYYFIALQIACITKNHSYSILSIGVNMSFAPTANNTLIGNREVL